MHLVPNRTVCTDGYRAYNALDVSEFYHCRINHAMAFVSLKRYSNGNVSC